MRTDGRRNDELRPIHLITGYQKAPAGSALIQWGETWVLCAASVDETVPPFRAASGGGWVTGEYNMLPGATRPRKSRRNGGRETEIQRLIGRVLRAAVNLQALGPRTVTVDCDVLQADGGTRVASITGGWVALGLALRKLERDGLVRGEVLRTPLAAVSVGMVDGEARLDLPYVEDAAADVDLNVAMTADGKLVEVQGTAEGAPFERSQLDAMLELGRQGIERLCELQARALGAGLDGGRVPISL
ncbi:MAG: ribonuclease PH [Deltaproteobacteria bacterium]|nr:ribonuclease PH [Deltaproteobacteria bacterium]